MHLTISRKKGTVLIAVLILLLVLLVMGMTMLGIKSTQAKSALLMRYSLVAKYVAEAGIEDARVKLYKDMDFPPKNSIEDYFFSYSEDLVYPGDFTSLGEYIVTIDSSKNDPADAEKYDKTIIVTSEGIVKDQDGNIIARHKIRAVLDVAATVRGGTGQNPYLYRYIDWQDHSSL